MILLTRLNGSTYHLNPNLIETIEETPDTVIRLVGDKKLIVQEKTSEIIEKIIEYNRQIFIERTKVR